MFSIGPFSRYRFSESNQTYSQAPGTSAGVATVTGKGSRAARGASVGAATVTGRGTAGARGTASGTSTVTSFGAGAAKGTSVGAATVTGEGSTAWDRMLSQADAPIAYFAEIEPWVLTDRS